MRWVVLAIFVACKGDKPPPAPPPEPQPATGDTIVGSGAQVAVPERPVLPEASKPKPPTGKLSSSDTKFEAEDRDEHWAVDAEADIKKRFSRVRGGKLEQAECRQTQCRLTISGSESELSRTIADLEGARGLHGYAKSIMLTAPQQKADGSLELRAFAIFDR